MNAAAVNCELRLRFDSDVVSAVTITHFAGHSISHRTTAARARPHTRQHPWRPAQQQQQQARLALTRASRPPLRAATATTDTHPSHQQHATHSARVTQPGWPSVSLPPNCIFVSSHATLNPWADRRASRWSGSWQRLGSYASCSSCTGWTRAVSGSMTTARGGGGVWCGAVHRPCGPIPRGHQVQVSDALW